MANMRKKVNSELKELNIDIFKNANLLTTYHDTESQRILTEELRQLTARRDQILQAQGEKLAFIAKTRWYNEGEKSNKYFLNLLKRQSDKNEMTSLMINGIENSNEDVIKREVETYYQNLYNHGHNVNIEQNFLENMFTVEQDINDAINSPLTLNELWLSLKSLKATTPGPDGISNTYLKKLWDIFGPILLEAWNYSLQTNALCPSHKSSLLRLIPKTRPKIIEKLETNYSV